MGYRSEVAYIIRFKDKEQRDSFIALQLVKQDPDINEALKELKQLEDDKLLFHVPDWKWYSEYKEVKAHTSLYQEAVELYEDSAYLFYRLGEELEDIEQDDGGDVDDLWDYLSVHKYINIDIDTNQIKPILTEEGELA